ncbi:MAG: tRNA epoxyqueuosine(34) reductase QueG, partial [Anaerolineales bacterium]|nr:tRNA epoxyqueuosine(34) reductase QueG [Anaerolineales bacterium]
QRWIERGNHGNMNYLSSERALHRRADPLTILPECQSILVCGTMYLPRDSSTSTPSSPVQISSYALGEDYHTVLKERLERLVNIIEDRVNKPVKHRIYTDTGPLLERELAQRAGLGWIGKNTCLIHPQLGSYFLLAELLLEIPLQPDPHFSFDRCGTCTRCIDACPTGCILPDRTLDARRCISYLTIEEKQSIDHDLRGAIGGWLFGCDICQQVCPWNQRFAKPTEDPAFQPRPFLKQPTVADFLLLKPEEWRKPLKGSPLERPRRKGLVRNAIIVAGNARDESATSFLAKLLRSDPEPVVRAHAAWALGQIPGREAQSSLQTAANQETDSTVQGEIDQALSTS